MKIKYKIILAIVIPLLLAGIIAVARGEIFAVEGWNSLILWFVPIISIFFIVLIDKKK